MRYHNITHDDMLNGDGLRVVLWVAGCDHCCKGCQNPTTWDPEGGLLFDEAAKQEIFEQLDKSYISGLTFSGGDPLFSANRTAVRQLAEEVRAKYPDKTIWLYTGFTWEAVRNDPVMQYVDVLVDGEFQQETFDANLLWKGSANQRVIDVPKSLQQEKVVLHCGDFA
ncbi:MAG: anaerobic ribonucleoside-triphosphate reductase activating protein [Lachnospiraceae bacterium]|nr:anaerobic ribonucleoside-triphosphate reductase activating protein [Lachnospiraceae bacterium]